ncbi:MAG: endonuclease domain-containing protein [Candidatus Peribacteria bacterium]|jgi:very-short-patch-repair endonuclease|nr:endonuclease domain-containing protein [Candidatus Peribacteria bacterium]
MRGEASETSRGELKNIAKNKIMNLEKTKIRRLSYDKDLLSRTKNLRKIMTEPEKKLWFKFFKPFQQTYNIRVLRQRPINFYIADFYIPSYKTVIELD